MGNNLSREISIIYDLLFGYTDKLQYLRDELDKGKFNLPVDIALVIKINNYKNIIEDESEFRIEEIREGIINSINKYADDYTADSLSAFIEDNTIILLVNSDFAGDVDINKGIIKFAKYIKGELEADSDFVYSVGIGRSYDDLKGLIFSYKEALNACTTGHFLGEDITYIDNNVMLKKDIPIFISEMEDKLIKKINNKDLDEFNFLFNKIIKAIIDIRMEPEIIKTKVMELFFRILREIEDKRTVNKLSRYQEKILEVDTRKELVTTTTDISNRIFTILQRNFNSQDKKEEIKRALDYIEVNYKKDLALEEVARKVDLSIYYFSHLFKEEVGDSFVTYLNKLRINKAKQLLQENELNIGQICYDVGYNDPNYFTRVFKEYEDMTPSQYRKNN